MHAETRSTVNAPVEIVYPLVRDEMAKLVPYIPNVDKIEQVEYERLSDNELRILNHWYAKADVPKMLQSVIKPEFFQWKDHALWKDNDRCVEFRIESFVADKLYDLSGTNCFRAVNDKQSEIVVSFDLEIHAEKLPGVPKFVAKKLKGGVEELVKRLLTPNLTSMAKGLNEYFKKQGVQ